MLSFPIPLRILLAAHPELAGGEVVGRAGQGHARPGGAVAERDHVFVLQGDLGHGAGLGPHLGPVALSGDGADEALAGYREPLPMVFSGLFPIDGDDFENLREALGKLKLNDASISYAPESSGALGFGFRCGFLGLLHMEIVKERLEREFDLALIATAPSVEYLVTTTAGEKIKVDNPADLPEAQKID